MPMTDRSCDSTDHACLVVFLKAPARSKRRLAAEIGESATRVAEHLLACAIEDARAWPGPVVLAPAADDDAHWVGSQPDLAYDVVVQQGGSLGARINHVDRTLRARGFERLILIGADCPALDKAYLRQADAALAENDAVLGPASDGGVVLMAAKRPWPDIEALSWSTDRLLDELTARLNAEDWSLSMLEVLCDVDAAADLPAVAADLIRDARPARRRLAAWLSSRSRAVDDTR
jgi:rSAM/selenodomain-associated transferase 1